MVRFLVISLGGAFGSGARYLVSLWLPQLVGTALPYATVAVNVLGSFLLAIIMHLGGSANLLSPTAQLALGAGVMGGFTTYSTFNYETMKLLESGAWTLAATNIVLTLCGCMAAGFAGSAVARIVSAP